MVARDPAWALAAPLPEDPPLRCLGSAQRGERRRQPGSVHGEKSRLSDPWLWRAQCSPRHSLPRANAGTRSFLSSYAITSVLTPVSGSPAGRAFPAPGRRAGRGRAAGRTMVVAADAARRRLARAGPTGAHRVGSVLSPGALMPSDRGAAGLPVNIAEVLSEVTGVAATSGRLTERAEALLAQVRRLVPFDAGWISLLPPGQDVHVSLARSGYDQRGCGFLDGAAMLTDVGRGGLRRPRRPVRPRDLPFPPSELPGWAEYLQPAGFRDGISVGLFTPEGDYLGLLTMHSQTGDQFSDAVRDAVRLLAPPIASAVDPLRSVATIAAIIKQATAGTVLTPSAGALPLPGLPDHWLLAQGSRVLEEARAQLAQNGAHASFLAPLPGAAEGDSHARITVLAAPPDLQFFTAAVVMVSPTGDLHGLSRRELQVLGLLVTGASNEQIAAGLGITVRTVELHVDHVRAKLAASSRTAAAAARALRLGLFIPPSLLVRA